MKKKLVGMIATAALLTMALAGNVQAAEIRSVGPDGEADWDFWYSCYWQLFRQHL